MVKMFSPNIRMGRNCDLSAFDRGIIVGARRGGLSITETADRLGFSRTTVSRVYREWCEKQKTSSERQFCGRKRLVNEKGQRVMASLVQADRKATVTQITSRYNSGVQRSISERTARRTLKWMGYSSRRPHRVPRTDEQKEKEKMASSADKPLEGNLQGFKICYVQGDLFSCPEKDALAHCISEDCDMEAGIAVWFKWKYGGVEELQNQKKKIGDVAVLKKDQRCIYYLDRMWPGQLGVGQSFCDH
ncbi:uncharacterized protein [Hemitrygon akajei]|uniref:uncharacterized protein isoform X3 n=1 Tax=Hemitrygon akajei TaxID=2704970 RepID=UPI003BF94160